MDYLFMFNTHGIDAVFLDLENEAANIPWTFGSPIMDNVPIEISI